MSNKFTIYNSLKEGDKIYVHLRKGVASIGVAKFCKIFDSWIPFVATDYKACYLKTKIAQRNLAKKDPEVKEGIFVDGKLVNDFFRSKNK